MFLTCMMTLVGTLNVYLTKKKLGERKTAHQVVLE